MKAIASPVEGWMARLPRAAATALASLRLEPGFEALECGEEVWLRHRAPTPAALARLQQVPWSATYDLLPGELLRRHGRLIPETSVPAGAWIPLAQSFAIELPMDRQGGYASDWVPLRIAPGGGWRTPNLLCAQPAVWLAFAEEAAAIRLEKLRFAQSSDEVLIRGLPLPPISGMQFVEEAGIALPVGSRFAPEVSAVTVRTAIKAGAGETIVWHANGRVVCIPAEAWMPATRAIVRKLGANPES